MDSHLQTLSATLASIGLLQRELIHHPQPQPFTNATLAPLNPNAKPPKDFIREADLLERRLFHFPPVGGMLDEEARQTQTGQPEDEGGEAAAAELYPRNPEVRTVNVPTPLRPTTVGSANARKAGLSGRELDASANGNKEYDTRALLIAAQRLNDNYQRQPRARKHIKGLIKKNQELQNQAAAHTRQAAKLDAALAKIANGQDPTSMEDLAALLGKSEMLANTTADEEKKRLKKMKEAKEKAAKIRDELNREEMEVLALEEMKEEMLAKKRDFDRKVAAAAAASSNGASSATGSRQSVISNPRTASSVRGVPRPIASTQPPSKVATSRRSISAAASSAAPRAAVPPTASTSTTGQARLSLGAVAKAPGSSSSTSAPAARTPRSSQGPVATPPRQTPMADSEDDITVRLKPGELAAAAAASQPPASSPASTPSRRLAAKPSPASASRPKDPEPTDELERLTEKIWDSFGEHLRFFAPSLEASDFTTTLGLLRKSITYTGDGSSAAAGGDDGSSISGASSMDPPSSTSSLGGTNSSATAAPTALSRVTSLILLSLLQAPAPEHSVEFPLLKTKGKQWLEKQQGNAGADEDGDSLATKAVYAMVAKKLLRIRRTGGKARVGFS